MPPVRDVLQRFRRSEGLPIRCTPGKEFAEPCFASHASLFLPASRRKVTLAGTPFLADWKTRRIRITATEGTEVNRLRSFQRTRLRAGFGLVELVAVIVIMLMLTVMLLPALQWARESARKTVCLSNLRQLALANIQYHSTHRELPFGAAGGSGQDWQAFLLPYLEAYSIIERVDWREPKTRQQATQRRAEMVRLATTVLPLLCCPSQQSGMSEPRVVNGIANRVIGSYLGNAGNDVTSDNFSETGVDIRRGNGPLRAVNLSRRGGRGVRFDAVLDGLSQTMLLGEARYRLDDVCGICDRFTLYHPDFDQGVGSDFSEALGSTRYRINDESRSAELQELTFGSFHPQGLHIALLDGSVRWVDESIDLAAWRALGSCYEPPPKNPKAPRSPRSSLTRVGLSTATSLNSRFVPNSAPGEKIFQFENQATFSSFSAF